MQQQNSHRRRSFCHRTDRQSLIVKTENPFTNDAPWTKYEIFKAVFLGCTLFIPRVVLMLLSMLLLYLFSTLVSCGFPFEEDRGMMLHTVPLPRWRRICLL